MAVELQEFVCPNCDAANAAPFAGAHSISECMRCGVEIVSGGGPLPLSSAPIPTPPQSEADPRWQVSLERRVAVSDLARLEFYLLDNGRFWFSGKASIEPGCAVLLVDLQRSASIAIGQEFRRWCQVGYAGLGTS